MQLHHGRDRVGKVHPSPSRLDERSFDLTRDDVTGSNEAGRSLANILKFPAFLLARDHGVHRMSVFVRGNTRHLVGGMDVDPLIGQIRGLPIEIADLLHVLFKFLRIFNVGIEPVPRCMGL